MHILISFCLRIPGTAEPLRVAPPEAVAYPYAVNFLFPVVARLP